METRTVLVTGAAGLLGSHLVDALLDRGDRVVGVDNLATGDAANLAGAGTHGDFSFLRHDAAEPLETPGPLERIYHLASPASPPAYTKLAIPTLAVGAFGTYHLLRLAEARSARFLLASTSEVYGDPQVSPQGEDYWGHVNPVGARSMYDEAKRFAEALTMAFRRGPGVGTRIARIFNSYGPRMRLDDGRVVPNMLGQALRGEPLTVYGDGRQTRSFCYCTDTVDGLLRLMESDYEGPVNLGSPDEMTILQFAQAVQRAIGRELPVVHRPLPPDDPKRRQPDIARARRHLGWEPRTPLDEGLRETVAYFRGQVEAAPAPPRPARPSG